MPEKWDADRELTGEMVRAALVEALPGSDVVSIEYLGSGWDFDAYLVSDSHVARFPRRKAVAENLPREVKISEMVRRKVGDAFEIPRLEIHGKSRTHFRYPFLLQNYIEGVGLDKLPEPGADLAIELGHALSVLHAHPVSTDPKRFFGRESRDLGSFFEDVLDDGKEDRLLKKIIPEAHEWLYSSPEVPGNYSGPERFMHDDLCADHIIVDPDTGRLAGIIDWSDAAFGDPVLDFVVFAMSCGYGFSDAVLENYDLQVDRGFHERLEFYARALSIEWFFELVKRRKDLERPLLWIRNAFRLEQ